MKDKERLRKAFEHGGALSTFLVSNLPEEYTPLTFDDWYAEFIKDPNNRVYYIENIF